MVIAWLNESTPASANPQSIDIVLYPTSEFFISESTAYTLQSFNMFRLRVPSF